MQEDNNYKAHDRQAIIEYLKGGEITQVADIIEHSGANRLRVYPILFELEQENIILVSEREQMGAAKTVKLL